MLLCCASWTRTEMKPQAKRWAFCCRQLWSKQRNKLNRRTPPLLSASPSSLLLSPSTPALLHSTFPPPHSFAPVPFCPSGPGTEVYCWADLRVSTFDLWRTGTLGRNTRTEHSDDGGLVVFLLPIKWKYTHGQSLLCFTQNWIFEHSQEENRIAVEGNYKRLILIHKKRKE